VPTLRELQAAFAGALLDPEATAVAAHVAAGGVTPTARLQIYRHHVFASLTATLQAAYPVVCRLVDVRFFAYAAHEYVRRQPPAGPCLFEYGASFPDFLAAFPPCAGLSYLADVARLEWAMHAAAHAEEAAPLAPARVRRIPAGAIPALVLRLHPSLSVLRSPWPVQRIWEANQPAADPGATVDLAAGGACLEVRRRDDRVVVRETTPGDHAFHRALLDGQPLGDAAETALAAAPGFDLAAAIRRLLADGLVVDIVTIRARPGRPLTRMESHR
jgi:hypothetical protein